MIDTCLHKGSRDNMSIIIIAFPGAPEPNEEAAKREEKLEATLRKRVDEIVTEMGTAVEYGLLLKRLSEEHIPDLPPGGGLDAKCSFVSKVFKELCPKLADSCEVGSY